MRTWATDDLAAAAADAEGFRAHGELLALSRIDHTGGIESLLPREGLDDTTWQRHQAMVHLALQGRAEIVRAALHPARTEGTDPEES